VPLEPHLTKHPYVFNTLRAPEFHQQDAWNGRRDPLELPPRGQGALDRPAHYP